MIIILNQWLVPYLTIYILLYINLSDDGHGINGTTQD